MFDCRTNRTPIERLGSIGFWFGFVRLATPGLFKGRFPRIVRSNIFVNFHYAPYKKSYFIYVGNPEAVRKALSEVCI